MSSNTLKTVVSGLGRIAWQFHLPTLSKDPSFQLSAVSDPMSDRRAEAVSSYSGLHAYENYEEMILAEHPGLVVIASPTLFHSPQALFAMEHGADVFCEKPLSVTYEEGLELQACARRHGRKIMAFQPHRVVSEFTVLRGILSSGKLGRVFRSLRVSAMYNRRNDWQSRLDCGGGMLYNSGAHFVDQFLGMFGEAPLDIDGVYLQRAVTVGDAEDVVSLMVHNGRGVCGQIEINLAMAYGESSWTVYGTRGTARFSSATRQWNLRYMEPEALPKMNLQDNLAAAGRKYNVESNFPWKEESLPLENNNLALYYDYVKQYFIDGGEPLVPLTDTLEVMRILTECRKEPIHDLTEQ